MRFMKNLSALTILLLFIVSCQQSKTTDVISEDKRIASSTLELMPDAYNIGILIMDGVYNTELTAPYDIFQHTKFRKGIIPMNVFTIAPSLDVITSFEGLRMLPDFSYQSDDVPPIDILVVPSAEHHLDTDLENKEMIDWVRQVGTDALFVTSHCDGAFVLAKAGLLNDVASTTFPSDIPKYKEMFPELKIISDVLFVHDKKYITSAGGAKSFEAALYLCEYLYGKDVAQKLARGLVIDWDLKEVPRLIIK